MATKRGGTFCAHRGCTSKTGGGVSLFTFPKDPSRSTLWLRACNRKDLFDKSAIDLYKNYRLCEKHFEDKYMTQGKITRKRLFENAVPTIFPNVTFSIVDDEKPVKGVTRSAIPLAKEETILSTYRSLDPLDSLPEKTYEELDQKGSALEFTGKINNLSPQICRLCLEVTPAYECEAIEEIEKETLEGLLINIDFDITDNAVACNGCLKRLQDCFKFKLQITSFVNVDSKMDVNEDLSKRNPESCRVCQLCMLFIKDEGFDCTSVWDDGVILEEVFKNCLPETDLNAVRVVCKRCRSGTELYYEFMKKCREVDQRIKGFWQVAGTSKVILQDMLKLEELDRPVIVKKECLGVENNDMNIMEYPISEDVYIKNEEVDLKQEMDDGLGMSISDHSNDCDNFGNKSSKRKGDMTNNESEDMLPSGISEADEAQNDPHLNYFTCGVVSKFPKQETLNLQNDVDKTKSEIQERNVESAISLPDTFSSDADPNYIIISSSDEEDSVNRREYDKRKRKPTETVKERQTNSENMKKNSVKSSQSYSQIKRKSRAKTPQPPCNDKCRLRCNTKFSDSDRQKIFDDYWKLADLKRRWAFLLASIITPKYHYAKATSNRCRNNVFIFEIHDKKIRVCKHFFKATLSITNRPIKTVIEKRINPTGEMLDLRGKHGEHLKIHDNIKERIREHIKSILRIENVNTMRELIEGGRTVTELHRDYSEDCKSLNIAAVSYATYSRIFNNFIIKKQL